MSGKQSLSIIAGLILLNIATILYFIYGTDRTVKSSEIVASVGNTDISRADWMNKLETEHGKGTLQSMINEEVILQLAEKQKLSVTDHEISVEPVIRQILYGDAGNVSAFRNQDNFKEELKIEILLEKLLTMDAVITNQEAETYYKDNEDLQKSADFYYVSQIFVEEAEAETISKELKAGASFADITRQPTIDKVEDVGYVSIDSDAIPGEYKKTIASLKTGEWSQPIKVKEGYAFLYIKDFVGESELTLNKIQSILMRKIAMEQINTSISAEMLWKDLNVDWIYGK